MANIRVVLCIFFALIAGGCSQTVSEKLHVPTESPAQLACPKMVVVLPFADYFYTDNIRTGLVRNSIVMEYLVDRLVAKGVDVPVMEDVLGTMGDSQNDTDFSAIGRSTSPGKAISPQEYGGCPGRQSTGALNG